MKKKVNLIIKGILILLSMHCSWGNINSNSDCWFTDLNTKLENEDISSEFKSFIIEEKYSFNLYAILYYALRVEERTDNILTNIDNLKIIQKHIKHYPNKNSKNIVKEIKGEEGGWKKWKKVNFEDELYGDWDEILIKEFKDEINHNKKLKDLFDAAGRDKRVKLAYAWKLLYDFPELRLRSDVLESHIKVKRVWGPYKDVGKEPILLSSLTPAYKVPIKGGKDNIEELKNIFLKDGYDLSEGTINVIELPDKTLLVISGHDHLMALEQLGQLVIPIEKVHFNKVDKSLYNQIYFFLEVSKKMGIYTGNFEVKISPFDIHKMNDKIIEFITEKFDNSTIGPLQKVANIIREEYMEAFKIDFLRENEFAEIILENYSLALSWKITEIAGIDKAIGLDKKTLVFIDEFMKKNSGITITPEDIAEQIKIAGGFDQWKKQQTRIKIINGKEYIVEEHGSRNSLIYKRILSGNTYKKSISYAVMNTQGSPDTPFMVCYLEENTMITDFKNISANLRKHKVDQSVFEEAYKELRNEGVIEKIQFLWSKKTDPDYDLFKQALGQQSTLHEALQKTNTGKWDPIREFPLVLLKKIDEETIVLSFQKQVFKEGFYNEMLYRKHHRILLNDDLNKSSTLRSYIEEDPRLVYIWKIIADLKEQSINARQGENNSLIDVQQYYLESGKSTSEITKEIDKAGGWDKFRKRLKEQLEESDGGIINVNGKVYIRKIINGKKVDILDQNNDIRFLSYYLDQNYESSYATFYNQEGNFEFDISRMKGNDLDFSIFKDGLARLNKTEEVTNIISTLHKNYTPSTIENTNEFIKRLKKHNESAKEAAFSLIIGQWAKKLGYTDVEINQKHLENFLKGGVDLKLTLKFTKNKQGNDVLKQTVMDRLENFRRESKESISENKICINLAEQIAEENNTEKLARIFGSDKTIEGKEMWFSGKKYITKYSNTLVESDFNHLNLKLLDKKARKPYEIHVKDGELYNQEIGRLSSYTESYSAPLIFVMDANGKIYAGKYEKGILHQSSFLHSKDVVTAGQFEYDNIGGMLIINVKGKHYDCSIDSLKDLVEEITLRGVDISKIVIMNPRQ
ncbi:hypothetical protein [Aquimarina sp. AU58]|uniref:hypothetical protein n=1 Tax=Aquimarina sp. AU58 TaxID=1874112 RepID=UPI000D6EA252|nr:hypothetical protein [Aquimarina sp. AU58]